MLAKFIGGLTGGQDPISTHEKYKIYWSKLPNDSTDKREVSEELLQRFVVTCLKGDAIWFPDSFFRIHDGRK